MYLKYISYTNHISLSTILAIVHWIISKTINVILNMKFSSKISLFIYVETIFGTLISTKYVLGCIVHDNMGSHEDACFDIEVF